MNKALDFTGAPLVRTERLELSRGCFAGYCQTTTNHARPLKSVVCQIAQTLQLVGGGLLWCRKLPKYCPNLTSLLLCSLLASCVSPQHTIREVVKTIRLQPDHSVPAELIPVLYAVEGAIEAQLPVDVQIVTSGSVDRSTACLVRTVDWIEAMGLGGAVGNPANVEWSGPDIYPCQVKIKETVTDPDALRLYLSHELGHVILDDPTHNSDPASIMTGGVETGRQYHFTQRDLDALRN